MLVIALLGVIGIEALPVPLTVSIPRRALLCLSADIVPVVIGHFGASGFNTGNHMKRLTENSQREREL